MISEWRLRTQIFLAVSEWRQVPISVSVHFEIDTSAGFTHQLFLTEVLLLPFSSSSIVIGTDFLG
jgi:hypothetical protein